ncbi:hypothetical protein A5750_23275 [Mycobacterium sp. 852002-51613_SCH5001154]|uniref:hypothetical protein n=1 Tax=Mycobacterium sp. 852002-51613_SCH5001154 TaxID=1834104 RepID=UPI0007FF15DE|nr:hypothetical protein [Mycobacterium sp. 852002-51613_SCH5001154]OBF70496.1 hypothetical protein A5750_23275 [Mycobacterium sp. 852002-51613_SCH5001154]
MTNMAVTAVSGPEFDGPVKINPPFRCSHDGTLYRPGGVAHVPPVVAKCWIDSGYAAPADKPPRSRSKSG